MKPFLVGAGFFGLLLAVPATLSAFTALAVFLTYHGYHPHNPTPTWLDRWGTFSALTLLIGAGIYGAAAGAHRLLEEWTQA